MEKVLRKGNRHGRMSTNPQVLAKEDTSNKVELLKKNGTKPAEESLNLLVKAHFSTANN